jgi:hypothetical protein
MKRGEREEEAEERGEREGRERVGMRESDEEAQWRGGTINIFGGGAKVMVYRERERREDHRDIAASYLESRSQGYGLPREGEERGSWRHSCKLLAASYLLRFIYIYRVHG